MPVDEDVVVEVYDCSGGCALVDWTYEALVDGTPLPYGSLGGPFEVTIADGRVVAIAELYLP